MVNDGQKIQTITNKQIRKKKRKKISTKQLEENNILYYISTIS